MRVSVLVALILLLSAPVWADDRSALRRAYADLGTNPTGKSRKWCGNAMARWTGGPTYSGAYLKWGKAAGARPGAIAVMRGHIGIVGRGGCDAKSCEVISGNHSGKAGRRTVGMGRYKRSRIIAFRQP
jgi:hypothetical protein